MRVSTNEIHRQAVERMMEQQIRSSKTQNQLATGKRIINASDDPAGAARVLELDRIVGTLDRYQEASSGVVQQLSIEESVLDGVTNLLFRVKELAIQGANATQSEQSRLAINGEIRQRLDQLMGFANTKNGSEYIFSGYQSFTQPFTDDGAGNFNYNGDQGQRLTQIGPGRTVPSNDSGYDVFMAVKEGNGTFVTSANANNTGSGSITPGSLIEAGAWVSDDYRVEFTTNRNGESAYKIYQDPNGANTQIVPPPPLDADDYAIPFTSEQEIQNGTINSTVQLSNFAGFTDGETVSLTVGGTLVQLTPLVAATNVASELTAAINANATLAAAGITASVDSGTVTILDNDSNSLAVTNLIGSVGAPSMTGVAGSADIPVGDTSMTLSNFSSFANTDNVTFEINGTTVVMNNITAATFPADMATAITAAGITGVTATEAGGVVTIAGTNQPRTVLSNLTSTGAGAFDVAAAGISTGAGNTVFAANQSTETFTVTSGGTLFTDNGTANTLTSVSTAVTGIPGIEFRIDGDPAVGDQFDLTPSATRSMFDAMYDLITTMASTTRTGSEQAQFSTKMGSFLANLEQSLAQVDTVRAEIGARLNAIDTENEANSGAALLLKKTKSEIQDLDYASAISAFNLQLTALQAAQQSFAKIQGLSLFNYIQ